MAGHLFVLADSLAYHGPLQPEVPSDPRLWPNEAALEAALAAADPADRIVVFGSFYTVGGVLKAGLPRRGSAHTG